MIGGADVCISVNNSSENKTIFRSQNAGDRGAVEEF